MQPKLSQETLAHVRSVKAVGTAVDVHLETIVSTMRTKAGEKMARSTSDLVVGAVAKMNGDCARAVETDQQLTLERGDDKGISDRRYQAVEGAYEVVVKVRDSVRLLVGNNAVRELGVSGSTPRDATSLLNMAQMMLTALSAIPCQPSAIPGVVFNPATFVEMLRPVVKPLDDAITETAVDLRENEAALIARNRARTESVATFRVTANLVSALLEYAGLDEFAKRLKPAGRVPGTVAAPPEESEDSEETA